MTTATTTSRDASWLAALVMADDTEVVLRAAWADIAETIPELGALAFEGRRQARHKDNVDHTIRVTAKAPRRLVVRLAALFHDVGKPPTRRIEDDGTVTFWHHEQVGARLTRDILGRVGFDADLADDVAVVVELSGATKGAEIWSDAAVRRFVAAAGDRLDDIIDFAAVDVTSRHQDRHDAVAAQIAHVRARIAEVDALDAERAKRPVVSGDEVMARYGIAPGPAVGQALRAVMAAQEATDGFAPDDAWALLDERFA